MWQSMKKIFSVFHKIFRTIAVIFLVLVAFIASLVAYFFYEDSKLFQEAREENQIQLDMQNEVVLYKDSSFEYQPNQSYSCKMIAQVNNFDEEFGFFHNNSIANVEVSNLSDESGLVTLTTNDKKISLDFEKLDRNNAIILENISDAGESSMMTIVKDTGYATFFSTSQKNSISTNARGYCVSN